MIEGAARKPAIEAKGGVLIRLWNQAPSILFRLVLFVIFFLLIAPPAIVLISSFSRALFFTFPPQGLSLIAYERFIANPALVSALKVSTTVGLANMVFALVLGIGAAFVIDRYRFPGRDVLEAVLLAPLMLPVLVLSIAILMFISQLHIPRNFWLLTISHVLVTTPFVLRIMLAGMAGFERVLEEASASLGARPWQTIVKVTFPVLQPTILSAGVLAFVVSFGQVTLSIFLAGQKLATLPVVIWAYADYSYDVAITAVAAVIIFVTIVVLAIVEKTTGVERVF
ncbi:MAG: ABC transporter permease [Chloroflexi bacterium]|nr:ABC transporter permease [Chloroflexota bacterium]